MYFFICIQSEVSTKLEEVQHRNLFGDFISACGRLTQQTKQQINDLENHLVKYGYTKPKGIVKPNKNILKALRDFNVFRATLQGPGTQLRLH